MGNKINITVKDSHIPLDVLFNKEINEIKITEQIMQIKPKPITFRIMDDQVEGEEPGQGMVRFEIEGGGELVTSYVRKNEQEFFEFLLDFNQQKNGIQGSLANKGGDISNLVPQVSIRRRESSKMSNYGNSRLGMNPSKSPNFLRVSSRQRMTHRLSKIESDDDDDEDDSSSQDSKQNELNIRPSQNLNISNFGVGNENRPSFICSLTDSSEDKSKVKKSKDSSISSDELRDYMENTLVPKPRKPK